MAMVKHGGGRAPPPLPRGALREESRTPPQPAKRQCRSLHSKRGWPKAKLTSSISVSSSPPPPSPLSVFLEMRQM
eukprot:907213-Rhodomonas_salina.2